MDAFGQVIEAKNLSVPTVLRDMHAAKTKTYSGEVAVESGGLMARLICRLFGLPSAQMKQRFTLEVHPHKEGHLWIRRFGRTTTRSYLRYNQDTMYMEEVFGPACLHMDLTWSNQELKVEVVRLTLLGVPLPRAFVPRSAAREFVTADGRFGFDVSASLPGIGRLVRYHGELI